jgi:hypothetical protein
LFRGRKSEKKGRTLIKKRAKEERKDANLSGEYERSTKKREFKGCDLKGGRKAFEALIF